MTRPFAIDSFPAGDAYWVVVPSKSGDEVQVALDLGGGEGPSICVIEWIPSQSTPEGGFLAFSFNSECVFTAPEWLPRNVIASAKRMALDIYARQEEERRAEL